MTLDEAIKHCEKEAAEQCNNDCGKDHAPLAEWLKELKRLEEAEREAGGKHMKDLDDKDDMIPPTFRCRSKLQAPPKLVAGENFRISKREREARRYELTKIAFRELLRYYSSRSEYELTSYNGLADDAIAAADYILKKLDK